MPHLTSHAPQSAPTRMPMRAFTLVELMVVVVILGGLLALVIPAAQSLSVGAQAAAEQSSARQVVSAWRSWSFAHDGRLLPGRHDEGVSGALPATESPVIYNGQPVADESRVRWLWRLVPYLDDPERALWAGAHRDFYRNAITSDTTGFYTATLHPSFGINAEWLGGMQSNDSDTWTLSQFIQSQDDGARPLFAETISRLKRPAELVAFASSRGLHSDSHGGSGRPVEGWWRLSSPYRITGSGSEAAWARDDNGNWVVPDEASDPASSGFVSARHGGKVVVAAPDGAVHREAFEELTDMLRWSDDATHRDWAPALP